MANRKIMPCFCCTQNIPYAMDVLVILLNHANYLFENKLGMKNVLTIQRKHRAVLSFLVGANPLNLKDIFSLDCVVFFNRFLIFL